MAQKRRLQSDSEGEDDALGTQEQDDMELSRSKKNRLSSAQDEDHTEDIEEDSLDRSQRPDFTVSSTFEAEVGIIEKITMVNFMCHTMLEVPLGANVNFIVGRNGNGRSAVMTALVVGLGGKLTTTANSENSLKGFIKNKCSYAQVSIKLRNRGQDAYKPNDYGDCITVERRISKDGSGSYNIKAKDGRVVSQEKDELNHILHQFNIQVNSPVCVLNQDTSRNFLNSSDPKDKYKFFLKATQLEQISSDCELLIDQQDIITNTLERKQEAIPAMQRQVQVLEEKDKDIAKLKTMKEQVEELKKECVLAEVIVAEKTVELEEEVEKVQDAMSKQQLKEQQHKEKTRSLLEKAEAYRRLKKQMEERAKAYVNYRHFVAIRAKFFFQMMLSQRGYNGNMVFDHGSESLSLQVNVESGSKKAAFSTVSLIMSLWEAMDSPFFCLDEFDVFMDMENRRIGMEMMLKVAKEQPERQFIFLTPQDMSSIGNSEKVRIFRLQDPERGQTTLNSEAAEL